MSKPLLSDRIQALEDVNMQMLEKIKRLKAQVRHNQDVIKKCQRKQECQLSKERRQAERRRAIEKELEECKRINGLIP